MAYYKRDNCFSCWVEKDLDDAGEYFKAHEKSRCNFGDTSLQYGSISPGLPSKNVFPNSRLKTSASEPPKQATAGLIAKKKNADHH